MLLGRWASPCPGTVYLLGDTVNTASRMESKTKRKSSQLPPESPIWLKDYAILAGVLYIALSHTPKIGFSLACCSQHTEFEKRPTYYDMGGCTSYGKNRTEETCTSLNKSRQMRRLIGTKVGLLHNNRTLCERRIQD